jgi:hypothetical protein
MGYTHYFTAKKADNDQWNKFIDACKELKSKLPKHIKISGGDGTGKPEFSDEMVCFNGSGDNAYETFYIPKDSSEWDFCKTARNPYDLLVCAVLMAAKEHLGYEVTTDGDLEDWEDAIHFYKTTFFGDNVDPSTFIPDDLLEEW